MQSMSTIGLDIAKSVFQVRGAAGQFVMRLSVAVPTHPGIFPPSAAVHGRHRGLRVIPTIGPANCKALGIRCDWCLPPM